MAKMGFSNLTSLVLSFITISNIIYNKQEHYDKVTARNRWNAEYDFVIVGGGTAGCVLAARLSEDPAVTVLLMEAGGSETVLSNTPGLSESLLGTMLDWKHLSISQNHSCQSMNNRQCLLSSGRVIGGTSSVNRMYYLRGNPTDFDNWENRLGLKSWAWKDTFPYIIRNENQTDPERAKSGYFGLNGPVSIDKIPDSNRILDSFLLASKSNGYRVVDLNTGVSSATSLLQSTTKDGHRMSMSSAFLEPNLKRPNLHILSNSVAHQIIIESNRATGVKFYRNWKSHSVMANREVIVSAGAINSPKLLMLSGIGPERELRKHQIPVVVDLPVGENLHDHVGVLGLHFSVDIPEQTVSKQILKQYFQHGTGPLSESQFAATVFRFTAGQQSIIRDSNTANIGHDSPDLMLLAYVNSYAHKDTTAEMVEQRSNLQKEKWKTFYTPMKSTGKSQLTIVPTVLKPKSRGWVRLKSSNALEEPLINVNYLHHTNDIEQLVKGIRETLLIINQRPLQRINTRLLNAIVPGCEQYAPTQRKSQNQSLIGKDSTVVSDVDSSVQKSSQNNFLMTLIKRIFSAQRVKPKQARIGKTLNQNNFDKYWQSSRNTSYLYWRPDDLIDGFSSNSDMAIIETVWNSHKNPQHQMSLMPSSTSSSTIKPTPSNITSTTIAPVNINTNSSQGYSGVSIGSIGKNGFSTSTVLHSNKPSKINVKLLKPLHTPTEERLVVAGSVQTNGEDSSPETIKHHLPSLTEHYVINTTPLTPPQIPHQYSDFSDQYLQCMARMFTMPMGDYVGTCRMGADGDWRRVVDSKFRVVGVEALRVVDASIIPEIVSGSVAPIAVMIGERAAEYILRELN